VSTLLLLIWLALGVASFIYWWTTEFDFTTQEIVVALIMSVGGPVTFAIGYLVHAGNRGTSKILIQQRSRK
jgi:hypothetical protein